MNEEDQKEWEELVQPLMHFLRFKCHPHVTVIVTGANAELLEGSACVSREKSD